MIAISEDGPPAVPNYQLLRRIGQGAFGEVWLARNVLGAFRAVKIIQRAAFADASDYEREFSGMRNFEPISREHVGLVDVLDVGVNETKGYFYYAMELADDAAAGKRSDGEMRQTPDLSAPPLHHFTTSPLQHPDSYSPLTLSARLRADGRLPLAECLRVSVALTDALEFLHQQGLIHRDIKPSNIIFVGGVPKLADVGTVTRVDEAKTMMAGTEGFRAPEGSGKPQADLYSLGKVLYEISTGKDRQRFPEPLTKLADLTDREQWQEFNAVVDKACQPEPTRRYPSTTELRADLLTIQAGRSVRRQWLLQKRFKQTVWAAAAVVAVVALVLLIQSLRLREAEKGRALLELEKAIRPPHREGWSTNAWQMASNAAAKFGRDTNLQSQAAASLAGLDAKLLFQTNGVGGSSVAFDRDGKRVLFGSLRENTDDPGKAHLLDLDTTNLSAFPVPGEGPVAFLPDGTPVQFSADASHRLALWIVGQRVPPVSLTPRSSGREPAQTSPPGNQSRLTSAATTAQDAGAPPIALRTFTLGGGERIGAIESLAITPNGAFVAASGTNTAGRVFCAVWDGATGELLFVAASRQSAAELPSPEWRRSTEPPLREPPPLPAVPDAPATALALAPDGSLLAAGNDSGEVTVWRVSDGRPLPTINAGRNPIRSLAFCRDYVREPSQTTAPATWFLGVGDSGGGVTIWEVAGQRLRTRCPGAEHDRYGLTFSPDGTLVASAGRGLVKLWDTAMGSELLSLSDGDMYLDVSFAPDGKRIAVCSKRPSGVSQLIAWELENGRGIRTLRGLSRQIAKACFSADAKLLAAVAHDWQVGIWDLTNGQLRHVLNMPRGLFTADNAGLAFNPDGSQFAFMAGTNAMLFDVASGALVQNWMLPPGHVDELAFAPTGHLLAFHLEPTNAAATMFSKPVVPRIRDLSAQDPLASLIELPEFNSKVHAATWSHDGAFIVVEGVGIHSDKTNRWIKVVAPLARRILWQRDSGLKPSQGAYFCVDAAGKFVTFPLEPDQDLTDLCEAQSASCLRKLAFAPLALNSRIGFLVGRGGSGAWSLHSMGDESLFLIIQPGGTKASSHALVFSRDGHLLAWGNEDGTVSVCDLPETQRGLNAVKLGW